MYGTVDGKSKSNEEFILRNWKTLKQSIEPLHFVQELKTCKFLPQSSFDNLGNKNRSHQATLVLIKVYRQVQSSENKYRNFVEILRGYGTAADVLSNCVGGPINKPETVDKHLKEQTREHLERFEKKIKDKLRRNPNVVLEITDNFIECGLLDIDKVENILESPKEAAQRLVEFVFANIHLGAYNRLLETLKSEKSFKGLVSDLTTAGVGEDIKTAKPILQERRKASPGVTKETASGLALSLSTTPEIPNMYSSLLAQHSPADLVVFKTFGSTIATKKEETADKHSLSIRTKPDNPKMYKALLDVDSPADVSVFKHLGSMIEKKKEGSAILTFAPEGSNYDSTVKDKIQQGAMPRVMDDIIKYVDSSVLKELSELDVKVRCLNNNKRNMSTVLLPSATLLSGVSALQNIAQTQSEQQETESVQHTMNVTIIAANRSFLIEEISTMVLVRAFQDQGITCFDGVDCTLRRQQRAEHFLTILENNNLLDQLLVILREQGMTYVLDRLNNCRNAYSADPQILRRNIFNNRTNIIDYLDIDDVREIFIEREVFSSSMFDEIEEKYSGSVDQMSAVLIEIIKSRPCAMRILVDALYINQLYSLANSLLGGTPNELQEMQDNSQTDESSSDDELLYKATFVVSKADEDEFMYKASDVFF